MAVVYTSNQLLGFLFKSSLSTEQAKCVFASRGGTTIEKPKRDSTLKGCKTLVKQRLGHLGVLTLILFSHVKSIQWRSQRHVAPQFGKKDFYLLILFGFDVKHSKRRIGVGIET